MSLFLELMALQGQKIFDPKIWNTNNNDTLSIDSSDERDFGSKKICLPLQNETSVSGTHKNIYESDFLGKVRRPGSLEKKWAGPNVWLDESMIDWTKSRKLKNKNFRDDPKSWFLKLNIS